MRIHIYDLGYGVALTLGRCCLLKLRIPLPLRLSSWRYLLNRRKP